MGCLGQPSGSDLGTKNISSVPHFRRRKSNVEVNLLPTVWSIMQMTIVTGDG